jgi:hypothetical protein
VFGKTNFLMGAALLSVLTLGATSAFATALPITDSGLLSIANQSGSLVSIGADPFCINWGGGATCVAGTTHAMSVSGISNDFLDPSTGTIQDLVGLPGPTLTNFETVSGGGALTGQTIHFDLTSIPLINGGLGLGTCTGPAADAADNTCAPPSSPFKLSEDDFASQVTVQFSALLNAYTGASGSGTTAYRAIFSTTYSGTLSGSGACSGLAADITNILTCEAAGGTITSTWSGTESPVPGSPVPEPANIALLGAGLLALAAYRRRARA